MVVQRARGVEEAAALPLRPLVAEFTATFGVGWGPVTRRKHRDDFERFLAWLEASGIEPTTEALSFTTLATYVDDLRHRPRVRGVWRGSPDARARSLAAGPAETLSANSVNAYVRPLRSLVIWALDEGYVASNPFRRFRRRAALDPLLPSEETPTKGATLSDLWALEAGCAGERPRDLRDRAIVAILVTTAARNSAVRLLRLDDVDAERSLLRFWRGKGGKTLLVTLHPDARAALDALPQRRPAGPRGRSRPAGRPRVSVPLRARWPPTPRDECPQPDAHPPLPRRGRDAPVLREPPHPPRHRDPAREQRHAARGALPLHGPRLDPGHPAVRGPDARLARRTGSRGPR